MALKFNSKTLNWCTKEADVLSCRINQLLTFNQGYNRLRPVRFSKASQHLHDSYKEKKLIAANEELLLDDETINTDLCYTISETKKSSVDDTKLYENKKRQSRSKRRFLSLRKQRSEPKSREPIHPNVLQTYDLRNSIKK